jgi:hypothetical protein
MRWLLCLLVTIVTALLSAAGDVATSDVDPIRAGSLPFDTALLEPVQTDGQTFEVVLSYVNVISGSWHTGTIHEELGRNGEPIAPWELELLEGRHPSDEIYRLDLEGWQASLRWRAALTPKIDVAVEIPWLAYGQPHWDRLSETFHDGIGIGQNERPQFPRGESLVYVYGPDGRAELRESLADGGWGEARAAVAVSAGRWLGGRHRLVAAVEAPTGTATPLHGSGGWDVGARWLATWRLGAVELVGGAGKTWLDDSGSWVGFERSDTWHLLVQARAPLTRNLGCQLQIQRDSSPLADAFPVSRIGDTAVRVELGLQWRPRGDRWLGLAVTENLTRFGVAPDYSLHLSAGGIIWTGQ